MSKGSLRPGGVAERADFSSIRYAQCWEDADVLVAALSPLQGSSCLSIASGGDNTLSLLAAAPEHVLAIDLSEPQLACLELRVAAFSELDHREVLELLGWRGSRRRDSLYRRCRSLLSADVRRFWDARQHEMSEGIAPLGKFERYLKLWRTQLLPLVHRRELVDELFAPKTELERIEFYERRWDTARWRFMFKVFCSRSVLGRVGRDPSFFTYVQGSVATRLLGRVRHAVTVLDPTVNPYLQWILNGDRSTALPHALRPENFEDIRRHLDRLEWRRCSLESFLGAAEADSLDRFNLSDVFEYVGAAEYERLLGMIHRVARPGARLAYWNLLVARRSPQSLRAIFNPLTQTAAELHRADKAFFYSDFVLEEVA